MKTISCFSYKGGAGRSTLAINVVPFLAEELGASAEHPLILVDMDIDSCGLTYLFGLDKELEEDFLHYHSVQYYFGSDLFSAGGKSSRRGDSVAEHPLFSELPRVGKYFGMDDDASILCIPAKPGDSLGGNDNYDVGDDSKFQTFNNVCEKVGCCGVLLDSAVGNQLTASWSNAVSTHIMCCLRPTKQFREGTKRFFDEFDEHCGGKKVIVIPNVVPTDPLDLYDGEVIRKYPDYAKSEIEKAFEDNIENEVNDYILELVNGDVFGIPKIDRFMWQEGVLNNVPKNTLTEFERKAIGQYKKIARIIKEN